MASSKEAVPAQESKTDYSKISRNDFPYDFAFGAATSAYQVEGAAAKGGRGLSVWDAFTLSNPEKIADGSNGNEAVDMYTRYKEDIKMMKNMGFDSYRFSISWSRILPGGKLSLGVNREGIDYYNDVINTLLANGIEPYVTLFHWDLPFALEQEYGGFLSKNVVNDFRDYAELCFWEFGDRVKYWITLNEPTTYAIHGYVGYTFPPGKPDPKNKPSPSERKPDTEPDYKADSKPDDKEFAESLLSCRFPDYPEFAETLKSRFPDYAEFAESLVSRFPNYTEFAETLISRFPDYKEFAESLISRFPDYASLISRFPDHAEFAESLIARFTQLIQRPGYNFIPYRGFRGVERLLDLINYGAVDEPTLSLMSKASDDPPKFYSDYLTNQAKDVYTVGRNLLLAHAAAVESYRAHFQAHQKGIIGITLVTHWFEPYSDDESNIKAAKRALDFTLGWYLDPVLVGRYPQNMIDFVPEENLAPFTEEESNLLKGSIDFLGLNYYTAYYVENDPNPNVISGYNKDQQIRVHKIRNKEPIGPPSGAKWLSVVPWGIHKLLKYVDNTYNNCTYKLPDIYITENGVADLKNHELTANEACRDELRVNYYQDHLGNILKAMKEGVKVKGYFAWSWVDNFEWAEGYTYRFGMIYIDYVNHLKRFPKDSAIWFAKFLEKKKIEDAAYAKFLEEMKKKKEDEEKKKMDELFIKFLEEKKKKEENM